jgi:enterobactin synthetase component D
MRDGLPAFGEGVHFAQRRHDYSDGTLGALKCNVGLPERLHAAVARRQIDYLAGRDCARQALRDAGFDAPPPVATGQHGAPVWPTGFVGSISHCNGWALAAVARETQVQAIGIDMEEGMTAELALPIRKQIASDTEQHWLDQQPLPPEVALTLVFSAKESLFKALYPTVLRYFDFIDAEVTSLDLPAAALTLCLKTSLAKQHPCGMSYPVHFSWHEGRVLTRCVLGARLPQ